MITIIQFLITVAIIYIIVKVTKDDGDNNGPDNINMSGRNNKFLIPV